MLNETQRKFIKNISNDIILMMKCPKKGEEGYGEYIKELMIMGEAIEVGSTIRIRVSEKTCTGRVLKLSDADFKLLLCGKKEWKDQRNTKWISYHSVDEVEKLD